jgi:hypothetical protein
MMDNLIKSVIYCVKYLLSTLLGNFNLIKSVIYCVKYLLSTLLGNFIFQQ